MSDLQSSFVFDAPQRRYRVGELTREIADLLSVEFTDIWVEGEISEAKMSRQGHYYFTLKDQSAVLNCVCFRGNARLLRFRPEDGLAVAVRGRVDVYAARGQYQFLVEAMELRGQGALQLAFEQLKKKLAAEGLFDTARKRPLPSTPFRIGIVTSPTGAALQDMLNVLHRRFPGLHIRVYPTLVQGDGAAPQIAKAVRHFSEHPWADLVIVGRGGGSLEDLWAFNSEEVARAIAACQVPIISAVGHETDFTIADFVADLRAPTPSAAAELAVPRKSELLDALAQFALQAHRNLRFLLLDKQQHLHRLGTERSHTLLQRRLRTSAQRLDDLDFRTRDLLRGRLSSAGKRLQDLRQHLAHLQQSARLERAQATLAGLQQRLQSTMAQDLRIRLSAWERSCAHLNALSPLAVLERGYALAQRPDGNLVRDAAQLSEGASLRLRFARGSAAARVESVESP